MRLLKLIGVGAVVALVVSAAASGFAIVADPLPDAVQGTAYTYVPEIRGGAPPYAFYLEGGTLPDGMFIRESDGCICGTPTNYGTFTFNELGYESVGFPDEQHTDSPDFHLTVRPALNVTTDHLQSATVGQPYNVILTAYNAGGKSLVWSVSAGTLPAGITLAADGTLSGTPTTVGTSTFTAKVKDGDGGPRVATKSLTLAVVAPLAASAATPPKAEVGHAYKTSVTATGGLAPLTFAVAGGTAPPGLNVNAATGEVSGKPTAAGTFTFKVGVTDPDGRAASADLTITVAGKLELVAKSLRDAHFGSLYAAKLVAKNGVAPRKFKLVGGALPAHMRLGRATGLLSGAPAKLGTFRFRVKVTDALGASSTKTFVLKVLV
jgi:Putative Ig domain